MKSKYMDSDPLYAIERGYNEDTRMLMFHSTPIAFERLEEALSIINRYNVFDAKKVFEVLSRYFGKDFHYIIGREYSVVVYVLPHNGLQFPMFESDTKDQSEMRDLREELIADECDYDRIGKSIRIWWD